jgi:hypothetical protein
MGVTQRFADARGRGDLQSPAVSGIRRSGANRQIWLDVLCVPSALRCRTVALSPARHPASIFGDRFSPVAEASVPRRPLDDQRLRHTEVPAIGCRPLDAHLTFRVSGRRQSNRPTVLVIWEQVWGVAGSCAAAQWAIANRPYGGNAATICAALREHRDGAAW